MAQGFAWTPRFGKPVHKPLAITAFRPETNNSFIGVGCFYGYNDEESTGFYGHITYGLFV